jgi:mannosyltransferase OCH1-like enzyme
MNIIKIILLIFLFNFILGFLIEGFFDFENIPKKYGDSITDIKAPPTNKGVPKIIHHICPKDFTRWHPKWFHCYASWLRVFPKEEYNHMHWFDDELHEVIKSDGNEWFLPIFEGYNVNIKRIDMVRPFLLYKYGGVYADMDIEVHKNFFDQLHEEKVSIVESPYKGNEEISNCLMASPVGNNYWLLVIDRCYKHKDTYTLLATGPQLFSEIYREHPDLVHVLPDKLFNPAPWFDENKEIYTIHLNTVMWDGSQ